MHKIENPGQDVTAGIHGLCESRAAPFMTGFYLDHECNRPCFANNWFRPAAMYNSATVADAFVG